MFVNARSTWAAIKGLWATPPLPDPYRVGIDEVELFAAWVVASRDCSTNMDWPMYRSAQIIGVMILRLEATDDDQP